MDVGTRKLKSEDGQIFEVEESWLTLSKFLKDLINDYPDQDQDIPINQINSKYLKMIIDYLKHYEKIKPKEIVKTLPNGNLKEVLEEWDYNFINPLSIEETIDLLNGAFFLDIEELVNLTSAKIASEMLTGTVEEVKEKFEWKNISEEDKILYGIKNEPEPEEAKNEEEKEEEENKNVIKEEES